MATSARGDLVHKYLKATKARRGRRVSMPSVLLDIDKDTRSEGTVDSRPSNPDTVDSSQCKTVVSSLATKISNLERTIEDLQSQYHAVESKCNAYSMENEILRDSLAQCDDKSRAYYRLGKQYEEVKTDLESQRTTSKLLLERNRELDSQKDALNTKCEQLGQERNAYEREVFALREIEQSLNNNLISMSHAMNDSHSELLNMQQGQAEESMHIIHALKDEITRLNQKIEDLNHELSNANNGGDLLADMDTLDKRIFASPRRKCSVNNVYKCFCSRTKPTILSGEDMEAIQGHTRNSSNYSNSMTSTICDEYAAAQQEMDHTLWQEIDHQVHQIESLFAPNHITSSCCGSEPADLSHLIINEDRKSQTASCCGSEPGAVDSMENQKSHTASCCGSEHADSHCFVSEDEKDMEFTLDLDDLPQRLSDICNKIVILYSDLEEVGSLKEEHKRMADKVDTMSIERHTAQMRLRKALAEVDELNGMMSDLSTRLKGAQSLSQTKDEEIVLLQTDVNGYKRQIDEMMKSQNLSDRRVFISLQQQVDSLKLEAANYRKDIFALKNKQIDYDTMKKESMKANTAFERDLSGKIEERVLIENELQSMRRQYEILQQERAEAIDRHKRIKDSLWHQIDDQINQIESLLMSDIASSSTDPAVNVNIADLPRRLECIYNKMETEMVRIRNELDELDSLKEEHKTLSDKHHTSVGEGQTLQTQLDKVLAEVDELKTIVSDLSTSNKKAENTIKTKDEEIQMLQTDVAGYGAQMDEIMKSQNESDQRIFVSLQNQIDTLRQEVANYRKDIEVLNHKQIDYENIKREAMEAKNAFERDLSKEIEERVLIENELQSMRRQYQMFEREHVEQYMRTQFDSETDQNIIVKQQQQIKELETKQLTQKTYTQERKEMYQTQIAKLRNIMQEIQNEKNEYKQKNEALNKQIVSTKRTSYIKRVIALVVVVLLLCWYRYKRARNSSIRSALRAIYNRFMTGERVPAVQFVVPTPD
eukprot:134415_1